MFAARLQEQIQWRTPNQHTDTSLPLPVAQISRLPLPFGFGQVLPLPLTGPLGPKEWR